MNDENEVDSDGLATARWLRVLHALQEALMETDEPARSRLALSVEHELGLRSILDIAADKEEPIGTTELLVLLSEFGDSFPHYLPVVVPRLERALATLPSAWVAYVRETGCAAFDPTELAGACAIAKNNSEPGVKEHIAINALLARAVELILGQQPIPLVRSARLNEHPTIILDVIQAISKIELNWSVLGLTPVIDRRFALRWDELERWTAFVPLASTTPGKTVSDKILRLRSDGTWRLVRQ
jgi:hypothetical protein